MEGNSNQQSNESTPMQAVQPSQTLVTKNPTSPNPVKKPSKFSLKIIIGIIIFLLLAGIATAGYVYRAHMIKLITNPSPTPTPRATITPTLFKTSSMWIADYMMFAIPNGWIEESKKNYYYSLGSPEDIYSNAAAQHVPVVSIFITKRSGVDSQIDYEEQYKKLELSIDNPQSDENITNLSKLTIGGYPAYSYEYSFEGFRLNYSVKTHDAWWDIAVTSIDKNNLQKYTKEISDFIKSIEFKNHINTDKQT